MFRAITHTKPLLSLMIRAPKRLSQNNTRAPVLTRSGPSLNTALVDFSYRFLENIREALRRVRLVAQGALDRVGYAPSMP